MNRGRYLRANYRNRRNVRRSLTAKSRRLCVFTHKLRHAAIVCPPPRQTSVDMAGVETPLFPAAAKSLAKCPRRMGTTKKDRVQLHDCHRQRWD